ncbi:carbohydrate ABC transporter permease [Anaerocolumna chitinilytica]|uniref:ABC transporter permease n=1 Tax=Anaerocolumna chitinilytica TaxID=1727145 RepID=A0A7I8DKG0_9FIRM|nr:sugar ABC transporter permease [Anaerocolumna chitinilytica]BCJ97525.1 ABC transporter permease [Anaerocolumna chitinilytica]
MKKKSRINIAYYFLLPYLLLFVIFIIVPIIAAIVLSFTNYNAVERPNFVGLLNYINLLTQDDIFMQKVLPNTCIFAFIVGPVGYALSFLLAWMLAQVSKVPRTILALLIYSPSMTSGIAMAVVWKIIFAGDQMGYINYLLMDWGITNEPILFLTDAKYLLTIMIIVSLWSSMGVGFLAILAGILNIDTQVYEAASIDGLRNRFQEMFYITIPMMKPQMLFAAVMAVVNTFSVGAIGVQLSGANPTPLYSGQLIVNHIEDYGFIRYEMGYASCVSLVLLLVIYSISRFARRIFQDD